MTHYWDDYLEKHGVRTGAIDALARFEIDGSSLREIRGGLEHLAAMTREQLAAVPGLTDADVEQVLRVVHRGGDA